MMKRDKDCREIVKAFFNPADNMERNEDWADDPIRLTDNDESMEGRRDEWKEWSIYE